MLIWHSLHGSTSNGNRHAYKQPDSDSNSHFDPRPPTTIRPIRNHWAGSSPSFGFRIQIWIWISIYGCCVGSSSRYLGRSMAHLDFNLIRFLLICFVGVAIIVIEIVLERSFNGAWNLEHFWYCKVAANDESNWLKICKMCVVNGGILIAVTKANSFTIESPSPNDFQLM